MKEHQLLPVYQPDSIRAIAKLSLVTWKSKIAIRRLYSTSDLKHLHISCFPKSGSTYLLRILSELTGFKRILPIASRADCEQDIAEIRLLHHLHMNWICQQHLKGSKHNQFWINRFNIKTVLLVRNIYDTIVSLRDFIIRKNLRNLPTGMTQSSFPSEEKSKQYDMLIETHLSWYINFILSWMDNGEIPILNYETLINDTYGTVSFLSDYWKLGKNRDEIDGAIERASRAYTRLNIGRNGRGLEELNEQQIARINKGFQTFTLPDHMIENLGIGHNYTNATARE